MILDERDRLATKFDRKAEECRRDLDPANPGAVAQARVRGKSEAYAEAAREIRAWPAEESVISIGGTPFTATQIEAVFKFATRIGDQYLARHARDIINTYRRVPAR